MNTFALILFGYILYLAVNGKLTDYAALVQSQSTTSSATPPASTAETTTAPAPTTAELSTTSIPDVVSAPQ